MLSKMNALEKSEGVINRLLEIDSNNIFSDFCLPLPRNDSYSSDFYAKLIYPKAKIPYKKARILKDFFLSPAKVLCARLKSVLSREKELLGKINKDTELLVVDWARTPGFLERDEYFGTLFRDLKRKGRKFQILFFPLPGKDFIYKLQGNEYVIIRNSRGIILPKFSSFVGSLLKNILAIGKHHFSFWEKIMFFNSLCSTRPQRSIALYSVLNDLFASNKNLKTILLPWENQAEQKAICLAAHDNGKNVLGYIHSTFWADELQLARLKNREYDKALPDKLFLHSQLHKPVLERMGWRAADLIVIKSLRYEKLKQKEHFIGKLFLPYDVEESLFCIEETKKGIRNGLFAIKEIVCHPIKADDKKLKDKVKGVPVDKNATDTVVCGTTTISLEALGNGLEIFNIYRNPAALQFQLASLQGVKTKKVNEFVFKTVFAENPENAFFITDEKAKKVIDFL